jgi:hypothetical protein
LGMWMSLWSSRWRILAMLAVPACFAQRSMTAQHSRQQQRCTQ